MRKFTLLISLLFATAASINALDRVIGEPVRGKVKPEKARMLKKALEGTKGTARSLQYGYYYRPVEREPEEYYYEAPRYYEAAGPGPEYPSEYRYGYSDSYYEPRRYYGKGMKMKKKKKRMRHRSGYIYSIDKDHNLDHTVDNPFHGGLFDDRVYDDDDCELFVTQENFRFQEASANITLMGDTQSIGTIYVWSPQNIEQQDGTQVFEARISGTCTRTQSGEDAAGFCSFSIVDDLGDQLSFSGVLENEVGGNLVVTGGTGSLAGVIGDASVSVFAIGDEDLFDNAIYYDVSAVLGLIVCPAQTLGTDDAVMDDAYAHP